MNGNRHDYQRLDRKAIFKIILAADAGRKSQYSNGLCSSMLHLLRLTDRQD